MIATIDVWSIVKLGTVLYTFYSPLLVIACCFQDQLEIFSKLSSLFFFTIA